MKRNLFNIYSIDELKDSKENFDNVQSMMNNTNIKFSVLFFGESLGIIAYDVEEDSLNYSYLKRKGFNEKGI